MKKITKKALAILLVVATVFGMTGCSNGKKTNQADSSSTEAVSFPLKEEVTFTFMVQGTEEPNFQEKINNNVLWQELKKATNVNIEFDFLGQNHTEQFALRASSDDYGDVLFGGNILTSILASKYIASGFLQDLTPYVNETLMPNLSKQLESNAQTINMIKGQDGNIYTLPVVDGLEGTYLESPIWVNKAWLDKLGLSVPTTLDEFTNMLRAFKTKDPNGNGAQDEIPYICSTTHAYMHTEALLGLWGLATKDDELDAFVQVIDGEVRFVPTQDEYKEGITYLKQLYDEGLMWGQCFTASAATFTSKLSSATPVVGCFTAKEPAATEYSDDYICIAPPKVEGYEAKWYTHYAINGTKNSFFVTDKCENVNILMAWIDQFYDFETSFRSYYGEVEDGRYIINDGGKYEILDLDYKKLDEINRTTPSVYEMFGTIFRCITPEQYSEKIVLGKSEQTMQNNYQLYKDIMNTETWPRPYLATESVYDAEEYTTDIMYLVQSKRGAWITGKSDINKEWDSFKKQLDEMGLQEWLKIQQTAYDAVK